MKSFKRSVRVVARNNNIDADELLLRFWYRKEKKFEYLKNEHSIIKNKDLQLAKDLSRQKNRISKSDKEIKKTKQVNLITNAIENHDYSIGKIPGVVKYLTKQEVVKIHEELENDFLHSDNPILPAGIKSDAGLESALFHAQTCFEGRTKYKTVEAIGAALWYSISQNHCFHNGNKRTAIVAMLVHLDRYNIVLTCSEDVLFKTSVMIADHKIIDGKSHSADDEVYEIMKWIYENSRSVVKGERSITLRRLHHILSSFNCSIKNNEARRSLNKKTFFGKKVILRTKLPKAPLGDEVDKGVIKMIRTELELDAEHGIDLDAFYNEGEFTASEFIIQYKNLLKRLSKF